MQDEEVFSIASAMIDTISSYKNGLNIVHLNAQSLLKKIDEFRILFTQSNVDVICKYCQSSSWRGKRDLFKYKFFIIPTDIL